MKIKENQVKGAIIFCSCKAVVMQLSGSHHAVGRQSCLAVGSMKMTD